MTEMVRRFLRQKIGSLGTLIALALLSLLTAFQVAVMGATAALESGFLALVILAAGSVSRDARSGALQMILARPIRRTTYLFGRYAGILSAYAAYLAVTAGLAVALTAIGRQLSADRGGGALAAGELARGAAEAFLSGALFAAILLFFSTFLRGFGDVLAYILLTLALALPAALSGPLHKPWLAELGAVLRDNVLPRVPWQEVLRGESALRPATGQYLLALAAYLYLAALVFSRREFSYGQD